MLIIITLQLTVNLVRRVPVVRFSWFLVSAILNQLYVAYNMQHM